MNSKHLAALALALSATLAAGAAHAGGRADVQWSVTIGSPGVGLAVGGPVYAPRYEPRYEPVYAPIYAPVYAPRVYAPPAYAPRVYYPQPVVVVVPQRSVHRAGWGDADRDGIPNRYDRYDDHRYDHSYHPRRDRDGDGVPNRRDRDDRNPYRR